MRVYPVLSWGSTSITEIYMIITLDIALWASLDGRLKDSRTKSLFKTRLKINCTDNY